MENIIKRKESGPVSVIQNYQYEWAVVDDNDNIIVPFGEYTRIEGLILVWHASEPKGNSYTNNAVCIQQ